MLVEQVEQEGNGLDGLSEPHLISEDNTVAPEDWGWEKGILSLFYSYPQNIAATIHFIAHKKIPWLFQNFDITNSMLFPGQENNILKFHDFYRGFAWQWEPCTLFFK